MLLIKSVKVVDGSGGPVFQADVMVKGNRISAIGKFPNKKAEDIIDGLGMMLTPGFIDVNTASDHYLTLFTNPSQEDFLLQGVTTIVGGNSGSSLAPLLYGSLESIRKWTDVNQINIDWHTMEEFFDMLSSHPLGVNFATMAGHATIRRAILGEDARDLTENELNVMIKVVQQALDEGAIGVSFGLNFIHSNNTPFLELKAIAKLLYLKKRVCAIRLRDEEEHVAQSLGEVLRLYKNTEVQILVNNFRPKEGYEKQYEEALKLFSYSRNDQKIHFDSYPSRMSLMPLYTLLPRWFQKGNLEEMYKSIKEHHVLERIKNEFTMNKEFDFRIVHAPGAEYLEGITFEEFSQHHALSKLDAFFKLIEITKLRVILLQADGSIDFILNTFRSEHALLGSNRPSILPAKRKHYPEEILNLFPEFLTMVTKIGILTYPKAVEKMTSIPAKKFGIKERGLVKEGYIADLVLMREGAVEHVLVNGKRAVRYGAFNNTLAGTLLLPE